MTRRELLGSLIVLPLVSGCGPSYSVVSGFEHQGMVTVDFTELSDASKQPYDIVIVRPKSLTYPIYVFHNDKGYTAFAGVCTHKGCELQLEGEILACPCHGSEFGFNGSILSGPATEDLKQLTVKYLEHGLMITSS